MTDAPDFPVETWSPKNVSTQLEASAATVQELADRLRELEGNVDAVQTGTRPSTYMSVALEAQKLVEGNTSHAAIWRIAKDAADADIDRAVRRAREISGGE